VWKGEEEGESRTTTPEELPDMLNVVLATGGSTGLLPLLLVLVAAIALVSMIFVFRYRRRGGK
jgi:hypothetical protein